MSEAFLNTKKGKRDSNEINIPGYSNERKDRENKKGGGWIVYFDNDIKYERMTLLQNENIETVWFKIFPKHKESFLLCFVYRPPNSQTSWYTYFENEVVKGLSINDNILLMGDFNIDFLKPLPSKWSTFITTYGLHQMVVDPTRVTSTSVTLIDHIYSTNPTSLINVIVPSYAPGDHYPVSCTVNKFAKLIKDKPDSHFEIKYRNFKTFNDEMFLQDLSNQPFDIIQEINDPNEAMDMWYYLLVNVLDKHAPVVTRRVKNKCQPEWYTNEIGKSKFQRDYFHKKKDTENYKKI